MTRLAIVAATAALWLVACGGSDDATADAEQPPVAQVRDDVEGSLTAFFDGDFAERALYAPRVCPLTTWAFELLRSALADIDFNDLDLRFTSVSMLAPNRTEVSFECLKRDPDGEPPALSASHNGIWVLQDGRWRDAIGCTALN